MGQDERFDKKYYFLSNTTDMVCVRQNHQSDIIGWLDRQSFASTSEYTT